MRGLGSVSSVDVGCWDCVVEEEGFVDVDVRGKVYFVVILYTGIFLLVIV